MRYLLLICLFMQLSVFAQHRNENQKRPKLVIGLVVDQMRYDFLYRYANRYSKKGFSKLLREGHNCENVFINYLPSYTGPGHACIYTGSVPALHGISSNDWIDRITGSSVYCTQDEKVSNVGGSLKSGRMSPRNMWSSTITDELRLATNFKSKVIAISVKDRASILPGGHFANASYWIDDSLGHFMTSTFYMPELPKWVSEFNAAAYAKKYMSNAWTTKYPISTYTQSTHDDNAYEGKFTGETSTEFPHKLSHLKSSDIKKTPFGNSIVLDFAKQAIEKEQLGNRGETDFLCLSFSSPDYVGHMFGPNSIEIEDTYLRLDEEIADFLAYLDDNIGENNYTLFLTADHGVAHNPQFLIDHKMPAGFMFASTLKNELNNSLQKEFNYPGLIREIGENFIWLNDAGVDSSKAERKKIVESVMNILRYHNEVHFAMDMSQVQQSIVPQSIREMAINGFAKNRSGDILLILKPGWLDAYSKTGTTHGTWNPYDTHIPLVWFGKNINAGTTSETVYMTDIAATLASMLEIQMPNACIGKAIPKVYNKVQR